VGGSASVNVEYHGNLGLKGCKIIVSYDASVVSYENHRDIHADFNLVKIIDVPGTVAIYGFFYPIAAGDIPILTLYFIGIEQGKADVGIADSDLRNMNGNYQVFYHQDIDYAIEVEGDICVENSAPTVDNVLIESYDTERINPTMQGYIKDGDQATVTAIGSEFPDTDWASGVQSNDVRANLSNLGGSDEAIPDTFSYDEVSKTWQASWILNSVTCSPANGAIEISVSVTDKAGNGPDTGSGEITSDNTPPDIQDIAAVKTQDANGINLDKIDTTYVKNGDTVQITATVQDSTANHDVISGIPAENPSNHVKADLTVLNSEIGIASADYSNPTTAEWVIVLANSQDGQPSITITASDLVGNQSSVSDTPINVDNVPPEHVTNFEAEPGKAIQLTWTFQGSHDTDYWGIRICRKSSTHFHDGAPASLGYPRYDDSSPDVYPVYSPSDPDVSGDAYYVGEIANHDDYYPADANDAVLVERNGQNEKYKDNSADQDIYCYQSYVYDKAGNLSTADEDHYEDRDCATGYLLGDFDNNGKVSKKDLSAIQVALGKNHTFEHWTDFAFKKVRYMDCDIGPTAATQTHSDDSRYGLPKTDGVVDFDDLMIFTMNYDDVTPAPFFEPTAFEEGAPFVFLDSQHRTVAEGEIFPVALKLNPELRAKGAHLVLNYDARHFEVVNVTEGNIGPSFFRAETKGALININVVALGVDVPLTSATIANVEFRSKEATPESAIYLSRIDLRSVKNEKIDSELSNFSGGKLSLSVGKPDITKVYPNYPNPFNPETWIPFQLDKETDVMVKIYDLRGNLVKAVSLERIPAGYYLSKARAFHWNGRNDFGERVSSGIYFYQFKAGKVIKTSKMVVLK